MSFNKHGVKVDTTITKEELAISIKIERRPGVVAHALALMAGKKSLSVRDAMALAKAAFHAKKLGKGES